MIQLQNISLQFEGRPVLKEVSLNFEKGKISVILGPSGAGKSTILKAILGLVELSAGRILISGQDIYAMPENELLKVRRKIGMVFQGNALFDSLSVEDNVSYFLRYNTPLQEPEIAERVKSILSFVNLDNTQKMFPDQLSGGMKKRLAIARALAAGPDIILFDEPTTGLDPINTKAILSLIEKLKSLGTTAIIVTHILNDAIAIGDSLTVINDGIIVETGNIKKIMESGDPFIKEFFHELSNYKYLIK